ncbi:hypothetical protein [Sphaerotilus sp.]|uniref:hypothetical protein n=1 Tax=Sphaerotilus sp. TaxID=2093942 RepID=UPI002ACEDE46|nr:hypothetical protein [Sphaerotilus sp.]MDZ7858747.1 hypothetical protein [Sphaerotilus sp.]
MFWQEDPEMRAKHAIVCSESEIVAKNAILSWGAPSVLYRSMWGAGLESGGIARDTGLAVRDIGGSPIDAQQINLQMSCPAGTIGECWETVVH